MKNFIVIVFVMGFVVGTAPSANAAVNTTSESLTAVLMQQIAELQNLIKVSTGGVPSGSRLMSIDGPSKIPAGEKASWNHQTNRPVDYSTMRWTWGDGSKATSENSHIYKKPGTYKAKAEGLNEQGAVIDTVEFQVVVTKASKYKIKILNLDTTEDYEIGSSIPVSWRTFGIPKDIWIGVWVGFTLVNKTTGEEFFLTDAFSSKGGTENITIPSDSDYSQDGPIPPGKYRLKAYMYGEGTNKYPSTLSKPFDVIAER